MKKFILSVILICGFLLSDAQKTTGGNYTYIAQRYEWLAGVFKALGLPAGSGPAAFTAGQEPRAGAVYYDSLGADAGFYIWTGTVWALQGSPAAAELPDELIQPGYVIYSGTGLKFYITPSLARIGGVIYGTTYDSVTLAASDPTNPRKDVIYLATTGVEVLEGTPAGPASEPQLDGGQIKLTVVDVPALATTPGISISVIYDENTEWAITNSGTTTDPDQAAIVYRLTKATEVTSLTNDDRIFATNGSTVNLNAYNSISGFIKLKANMSGAANLRLRFFNGATVISNEVTIAINKLTTDWQAFSIPMTDFNFTGNTFADIVQIRYTGSAAHTGFYLDYFHFETGLLQPGSSTELAIGPIDGKTANPNGATIDNGYFYQQTATQTNPGLLSPADKTKLDSLHSEYFIDNIGDGEELATQPNDSTVGIKSLKAGTNVTLDVTDTTLTINSIGGGFGDVGADFVISNDSLKNKGWVNIEDFGAVGDDATDNTAAVLAAYATGKDVIIPIGKFRVTGPANTSIIIPSRGQKTIGLNRFRSILKTTADARILHPQDFCEVENVGFEGDNSKSSATDANQAGIVFSTSDTLVSITNCYFKNIGGSTAYTGGGIRVSAIENTYQIGGVINNNIFENCYNGIIVNSRGEYINISNNKFTNTHVGLWNSAGNTSVVNNTFQSCDTASIVYGGTNNGHCISSANTYNHNTVNLVVDGVTNGHTFNGDMLYAGNIVIRNSAGIKFLNCDFSTGTITLTNNTNLYRSGRWLTMTKSLVSGEDFSVLGETKTGAGAIPWIDQYSLIDTVRFRGPMFHNGVIPASASATDSLYAKRATDGQSVLVAQSDLGGGATPGIDDVLAEAQAVTTGRTISLSGNTLGITGTASAVTFNDALGAIRITNSSTSALSIASTNAGTGNFITRAASSDAFPVASFKNTTDGTNTSARVLSLGRATTGTPANGLASELYFSLETAGTGASEDILSNRIISRFSIVDHPTRTSQFDITGIDNATEETFMNIQKDLVRINNNADTLATLQDVRDGGVGGGGTIGQTYLITHTSGTTWTTPSDITTATRFKITMVGGGGGGAGLNQLNGEAGGGGGGGALIVYVTGLTASTGYTMAIGAAGAGGTGAPTNGSAGGNTTLTIGATTYTANGGAGAVTVTGGAGGTATNGDINITGQDGGSSAGGASSSVPGVAGGSSAFGLGVGGQAQGNAGNGKPGTGYGGGGGGGVSTASTGGDGTQGIIIIEYVN